MSATIQASWLQSASTAASGSPAQSGASSVASTALVGIDPIRIGLALALCLALGILAILVIRRGQGINRKWLPEEGARHINLVDTARLNTRVTLYLVECGCRIVLVASDGNGVKLLDAYDKLVPESRV
jgi:flagellar protein FliO/FliZ